MREQASTSRSTESDDQRERRFQELREHASTFRATESVDQRERRFQEMREQPSTSRATESVSYTHLPRWMTGLANEKIF